MTASDPAPGDDRVLNAVSKLTLLRDCERALLGAVACGSAAIPALRDLLFSRSRDGIFEPRCLAVQALGLLHAREVLLEFLGIAREASDPREQTAEDAVLNATARALRRMPGDDVLALLIAQSRRKLLAGVIYALGDYRPLDCIPIFLAALAEDFCRVAAEEALRKIGRPSLDALVALATDYGDQTIEYESHRRARRSAIRLVAELGGASNAAVMPLVGDADPRIALSACEIMLASARREETSLVIGRLRELATCKEWMVRDEAAALLDAQQVPKATTGKLVYLPAGSGSEREALTR